MGLRQPATKRWEIPEPTPVLLPAKPAPIPEPAKAPEREREKVPA